MARIVAGRLIDPRQEEGKGEEEGKEEERKERKEVKRGAKKEEMADAYRLTSGTLAAPASRRQINHRPIFI